MICDALITGAFPVAAYGQRLSERPQEPIHTHHAYRIPTAVGSLCRIAGVLLFSLTGVRRNQHSGNPRDCQGGKRDKDVFWLYLKKGEIKCGE